MLPRMLRLPIGTSRRAYSFFSSKPGGGRYFNSAKPHKVAPASATASTGNAKVKSDDGSPSPPPSSPSPPEDVAVKNTGESDPPPPPVSQESPFPPRPAAPRLPPHPTFSSHTYPLHHFFSLHRPLLLLPLPTSTLFESPSSSLNEITSPPAPSPDTSALQFEDSTEPSGDADADAARQLARALALNRVGGWIDWEHTLARLGDAESLRAFEDSAPVPTLGTTDVSMDSTKRKRRKKMSKHKYKKRRRSQRSERRKMGK